MKVEEIAKRIQQEFHHAADIIIIYLDDTCIIYRLVTEKDPLIIWWNK